MHTQITIAALALMTFAILLLRIFWQRIPPTARFYLIRAAIVLFTLHIVITPTKWETISDHVNVAIKWLAIASYELLVMLFSSLRPRWLTTVCAFILLVPVFASSIIMPLEPIFDPAVYEIKPLSHNLFYQNVPWGGGESSENSGSDLKIFYRPPFAPFLRRISLVFPFNVRECDAAASIPILQPDGKHVLAKCPRWPSQGSGTDDRLFPLR